MNAGLYRIIQNLSYCVQGYRHWSNVWYYNVYMYRFSGEAQTGFIIGLIPSYCVHMTNVIEIIKMING